ncbi:NAD-dependent epimerase/dehydratase family protein [Desulfovibrio litoralis]|uniref:UDP-glucose 4-epimerase n=1 Tax=Desulfovibrio litoralis DSM 11393 TaxID=1121455 RepID=A0A1M7TKM1_9BACT|nr:NAD(P)-dependent oxidoreductase [Desulfovibrio litoralis]SHN71246.1 UDP-glucose 4-epimerase [Desulfovibrio litoralis DSM 11393]
MKVLITGAFGFIGSWLCRYFSEQGHEVIALTSKQRQGENALSKFYKELVTVDITKSPEEIADKLSDNIDCCVHAASFNEHFMPNYPKLALEINGLGTRNILEALRLKGLKNSGHRLGSFIYLSTFHVYGVSSGLVRESDSLNPKNDYALSHLVGEEYCRMFTRRYDMPNIILRLSNGYGAPQNISFNKWYLLLHDLCKEVFNNATLTLKSDPNTKRDFVWLGDICKVIERLSLILPKRYDLFGQSVNLASGKAISIKEVAKEIIEAYACFSGKQALLNELRSSEGSGSLLENKLVIDNLLLRSILDNDFEFKQCIKAEAFETFKFLERYQVS